MTAFEISSLQIAGYAGLPLSNRFFRNSQPSQQHPKTLAVILPGLNYSCDMPLLFYPAKLMLDRGMDVLQVHSDYTSSIYQAANRQDQAVWLATDTQAALRTGRAQDDYRQMVLVGKSIGTLALASLVAGDHDLKTVVIWLTPLLGQARLVQAAISTTLPGLFVASRSDPTFQASGLEQIQSQARTEALLFDGANHSLEIPGDVFRSLEIMRQVLQAIQSFVENHLD